MHRGYNLELEKRYFNKDDDDEYYQIGRRLHNKNKKQVKATLESFISSDFSLNGDLNLEVNDEGLFSRFTLEGMFSFLFILFFNEFSLLLIFSCWGVVFVFNFSSFSVRYVLKFFKFIPQFSQ